MDKISTYCGNLIDFHFLKSMSDKNEEEYKKEETKVGMRNREGRDKQVGSKKCFHMAELV